MLHQDFVEQEASEEVEEREDGESDEVSEDEIYAPDHLSLAFVNGTIGPLQCTKVPRLCKQLDELS